MHVNTLLIMLHLALPYKGSFEEIPSLSSLLATLLTILSELGESEALELPSPLCY